MTDNTFIFLYLSSKWLMKATKFTLLKNTSMKVVVIGSGYVGLVTGACFAEMGNKVVCVDIDQEKIDALKQGIMPIYEPGLEEIVKANLQKQRLRFTYQLSEAIQEASIIFIAVGTPACPAGEADLTHVISVAQAIGDYLHRYALIVTKSTVPVGTTHKVQQVIQERITARGVRISFDVVSNPEFLKEGTAVENFLKPDRIIVGVASEQAKEAMQQLYRPFIVNGSPILWMDIISSEMTKYAANAMLATKISFINEMANLCEKVGANIKHIRLGIGSDPRIGDQFIDPGVGYGGSCFPKDIRALIHTAQHNHYPLKVIEAVYHVNEAQKLVLYHKIKKYFSHAGLQGKKIAIWGLSFKPKTDDIREAPSLKLIEKLLNQGCHIAAYDPVAIENTRKVLGTKITYAVDPYDALKGADALAIVTEWPEFRFPKLAFIKKQMTTPVIFDGRNILDEQEVKTQGFAYQGIGIGKHSFVATEEVL